MKLPTGSSWVYSILEYLVQHIPTWPISFRSHFVVAPSSRTRHISVTSCSCLEWSWNHGIHQPLIDDRKGCCGLTAGSTVLDWWRIEPLPARVPGGTKRITTDIRYFTPWFNSYSWWTEQKTSQHSSPKTQGLKGKDMFFGWLNLDLHVGHLGHPWHLPIGLGPQAGHLGIVAHTNLGSSVTP